MVHEHDYEERHITVIDEDGNEQLCEVIHTFDSEKFGKSYVLYTIVVRKKMKMVKSKFSLLHLLLLKMEKMENFSRLKRKKNGI